MNIRCTIDGNNFFFWNLSEEWRKRTKIVVYNYYANSPRAFKHFENLYLSHMLSNLHEPLGANGHEDGICRKHKRRTKKNSPPVPKIACGTFTPLELVGGGACARDFGGARLPWKGVLPLPRRSHNSEFVGQVSQESRSWQVCALDRDNNNK